MIAFKIFFLSNFRKILALLFFSVFNQLLIAQNNILLTIDNQPITVNEFEYIYNKNSDVVIEKSQQEINTYLDLFINFKLKLIDARKMGLDTTKSYKSELSKYRAQLVEPYLKDEQAVELLAKEAYNRLGYDINA
ncbi:MAG: peptidylprolyl isomerase, partial [Flavobacteriaceae bacterium]|nr:peptidylprolyl isomerase [Flavobacteriaceae bacterium]